ncbi:MAG: hypothetical protein ACRDQ4_21700 [Pseudonocardiaceae bacterium]
MAISDAQQTTAPDLPWIATIHNAVRADIFPFRAAKEDFALFLGRFHPDKAAAPRSWRGGGALEIVVSGRTGIIVDHPLLRGSRRALWSLLSAGPEPRPRHSVRPCA